MIDQAREPNYLHGTADNVAHHVVCSVCSEWTDHETGRVDPDKQRVRLCLACDLFDAEVARRRVPELQAAIRALLHDLVQKETDCIALARQLAERDAQVAAQASIIRDKCGAHVDPTLDIAAVTSDETATADLPKEIAA